MKNQKEHFYVNRICPEKNPFLGHLQLCVDIEKMARSQVVVSWTVIKEIRVNSPSL